jgi:ankyrin repeat protein
MCPHTATYVSAHCLHVCPQTKKRGSVDARDLLQWTPLTHTPVPVPSHCLPKKKKTVDARDLFQWTPLTHSPVPVSSHCLPYQKKKTVDARDLFQWTPLHYAALKGRADACSALLHCEYCQKVFPCSTGISRSLWRHWKASFFLK